jgi:PHO85 cyclin-6/7
MSSPPQTTIKVRDLAHIQSLARADLLTGTGSGILNDPPLQAMRYEISAMPIGDIIEMVAALLTKITTTNDLQHDALNRNATHIRQAQAANNTVFDNTTNSGVAGGGSETPGSGGHSNMSPLASSVLAFHGKNVPAITILSYLSRIHKYCPTTYEVFLSLLVYFDRMTERVNDLVMRSEEARRMSVPAAPDQGREAGGARGGEGTGGVEADTVMHDAESDDSGELDSDLADDDDDEDHDAVDDEPAPRPPQPSDVPRAPRGSTGSSGGAAVRANVPPATSAAAAQATYFVVDSFNIHRLIIAGVTCASKFFSDVFYTNSRYAKVVSLCPN